MEQKAIAKEDKLSKDVLALIIALIAGGLVFIFIYLWYDLKLTSLKTQPSKADTSQIFSQQ